MIRLLGDTGLGGERSTGMGLFEAVEFRDWTCSIPPASDHAPVQLSLSLVCPCDPTELDRFLAYQTTIRGGGILPRSGQAMRKRQRMLTEGSLHRDQVEGMIVDLSPEGTDLAHPILRYGRNLSIPIHPDLTAHLSSQSFALWIRS